MPAKNSGTLTERLSASFKQLSAAATYLNNVSDTLGKNIGLIDSRLKKLKIGVTVWIRFSEEQKDDTENVSTYEIGFAKIPRGESWGIGIRRISWASSDSNPEEEIKPFNECSRELRLQSVGKIPDLIEQLTREVSTKASEIKPIVDQTEDFARALQMALDKSDESEEAE
jgi:hypothetical protein